MVRNKNGGIKCPPKSHSVLSELSSEIDWDENNQMLISLYKPKKKRYEWNIEGYKKFVENEHDGVKITSENANQIFNRFIAHNSNVGGSGNVYRNIIDKVENLRKTINKQYGCVVGNKGKREFFIKYLKTKF